MRKNAAHCMKGSLMISSENLERKDLPELSDSRDVKRKVVALILKFFPVFSVLAALLVSSILIAMAGINPWEAFAELIKGSLGNKYGLGETLNKFVPLQLCGLAFLFGLKSGFFNAGTEGQFYVGALAGAMAGIYFTGLPPALHVLAVMLVSFTAGAIWASIAGVLKVTLGVSEIINTIMLIYIANLLVDHLIDGPLAEPGGQISQTAPIADSARLPILISGTRIHTGFPIALLITLVVYIIISRTSLGYQLRMAGQNPEVARFSGMNNKKLIMISVLISGGLAGIAGSIETMGSLIRLTPGFSGGYGADAIGVVILGNASPLGLTIASLLFSVLRVGAGGMQRNLGVPYPLVNVIQGLIILFVVGGSYISKKLELSFGRRY